MASLKVAIYINAALAFTAAAASAVRGKKYIYGVENEPEEKLKRTKTIDSQAQ